MLEHLCETQTGTCKHTHTKPHSEDRESKGHVWRRSPWEVKSRDCTCVPSPIAHTSSSSSSCTHTITHTPCSPLREKHLLLLQCAETTVMRKERVGKQGMERKKHIRGSLPVAAQHAPSLPQSRQSSGASLTHGLTQTHTDQCYTRDWTASSFRLMAKQWKDCRRDAGL